MDFATIRSSSPKQRQQVLVENPAPSAGARTKGLKHLRGEGQLVPQMLKPWEQRWEGVNPTSCPLFPQNFWEGVDKMIVFYLKPHFGKVSTRTSQSSKGVPTKGASPKVLGCPRKQMASAKWPSFGLAEAKAMLKMLLKQKNKLFRRQIRWDDDKLTRCLEPNLFIPKPLKLDLCGSGLASELKLCFGHSGNPLSFVD